MEITMKNLSLPTKIGHLQFLFPLVYPPPLPRTLTISSSSQVPKTSVNLDGDVREKFMFLPSILTQRSREWGVSQIFTGRILHSGLNFR